MDKSKRIIITEDLNPEDEAMLQALYSRSAESVTTHLEKIKVKGSGKFMESWYVEYGHGSIGEGGTITIYIENVSILAAKAFQDSPLYAGQETSTRYINMAEQPLIDPLSSFRSHSILHAWMSFYTSVQTETADHLKKVYPRKVDEDEKTYEKAIKARVFDTLRAFLPAGICTQLSWHTSLRHAADRLAILRHHPLLEVKTIAEEILTQLKEKFPSSFSHKTYPDQENYNKEMARLYTYYHNQDCSEFSFNTDIKPESLEAHKIAFTTRPIKTNLPPVLRKLGNCTCNFLLDYGSSRDAQRHRNGVFLMPLLTTKIGFHQWYLNEISPETRKKAEELITQQIELISDIDANPETLQYYIPLGFLVSCQTYYSLPQMVYVIELRSDKTVHPTYREVALKMGDALRTHFPIIALHADTEESNWDVRRGKQDIIRREEKIV